MCGCVVCSLAAFSGAAVIPQAAAARQAFLYLVLTDHRTELVLDDRVGFSPITLK